MLRHIAAALLALAALGASAPADSHAADADSVTIGVRPAGGERTRFEPTLDPESTYEDAVEVVNPGTQPIAVTVFASDALLTESGAFGLQPAGQDPVDGGSWVGFGTPAESSSVSATIPAGESVQVPFRVTVPADAAPGDHLAAVVARVDDAAEEVVVRQHRVAVRLLLHVTGELHPELRIAQPTADYRVTSPVGGAVDVSATLTNTGNVALRARPTVQVSALFGLWQTSASWDETDLLPPGAVLTVSGEVADIPAFGLLTVTMTVATAVDDDAPDPGALPVRASTTTVWAWSWTIGGLALLVAALIVLLVTSRRTSRRRFDRRVQAAVSERLGSTEHATRR